jgi:hypothetical protein
MTREEEGGRRKRRNGAVEKQGSKKGAPTTKINALQSAFCRRFLSFLY